MALRQAVPDLHGRAFGRRGPDVGSALLAELLVELNKRLDLGGGYSIDKFDIPKAGDKPAAEMYRLFHPDPPTSVRAIDGDGN